MRRAAEGSITLGNNAEFSRHRGHGFQAPYAYPGPSSAQMALLWCGDDKVVVTPSTLPATWVEDVCSTLGYQSVFCLAPRAPSGCLTADLLADREQLETALAAVGKARVYLSPRGVTAEVLQLASALERSGVAVDRQHLPAPDALWSVESADSKLGGRELAHMAAYDSTLRLPEARVCLSEDAALAAAKYFLCRDGFVVLKSNHGSGGVGVRVLTAASCLQPEICAPALWTDRVLIVEQYVGRKTSVCYPSFHGVVSGETVEGRGVGLQMMNGTTFVGSTSGVGVLDPSVHRMVDSSGRRIGAVLAQTGFRGWFNVDFLYDWQLSRLYFMEINARRSGTSTAIDVATRLKGPGWAAGLVVQAMEQFAVGPGLTLAEVLRSLREIRARWHSEGAGVLLSMVEPLETKAQVGIIAWARSTEAMSRLVAEITVYLGAPDER